MPLYTFHRNKKFTDIWTKADDFVTDYKASGLSGAIDDEHARTLYYLLYSRYGNSTIASSDENRFKYSAYMIIWESGPAWQKKLNLQKKLREMTEDDLAEAGRQIFNRADNPATDPGVLTDEELRYINNQTVAKNRKGKLESYALLLQLLEDDVTEPFLSRFTKLFITFVLSEIPILYESEGEDDDD